MKAEPSSARKPTAERRDEICRAVLAVIGRRGVAALSTTTLAAEVGLTTGALFRHFESIDDILVATTRRGLAAIEDTFPDPSLPPRDRLLELADNRIRVLGANPGLAWLVRSEDATLALPADAVKMLERVVKRSRRFLLDAIREGAADGTIRDDIDPALLIVPVMGTIHAAAGMTGVHRTAGGARRGGRAQIIDTLARILTPVTKNRRQSK